MANKPVSAEVHPGPGFRVRLDFPRLQEDIIEMFSDFDTPDISDMMNRLYAFDAGIRCLTGPNHRLVGHACTVKVFPGDNLMMHKALDVARPGDVIVVDARASTMNAVLGDLISMKAQSRRIAGVIVDGYVRDLPAILKLDFPVFARGTTPIGPLHRGPGEINYPVCCGGVVVNPGDIVIADQAGIVIVPKAHVAEIHQRLTMRARSNADYIEAVRQGRFSNHWVDGLLDAAGCEMNGY